MRICFKFLGCRLLFIILAFARMSPIFLSFPNIGRFKPKNLKQILTKAKFEDDTRDEAPKVLKCKNTKCGICENIIEGESFTFKNGPTFKVKTDMSCTSKNLLYDVKDVGRTI